jgi:hypothetical protein
LQAGAGSTGALVQHLMELVGTLRPHRTTPCSLHSVSLRAREFLARVVPGDGNNEIGRKAGPSFDRAIDRDALSRVRNPSVLASKTILLMPCPNSMQSSIITSWSSRVQDQRRAAKAGFSAGCARYRRPKKACPCPSIDGLLQSLRVWGACVPQLAREE